jgi:hypothetical protein
MRAAHSMLDRSSEIGARTRDGPITPPNYAKCKLHVCGTYRARTCLAGCLTGSIIPGFMCQGGDITRGDGTGAPCSICGFCRVDAMRARIAVGGRRGVDIRRDVPRRELLAETQRRGDRVDGERR